MSGFAIGVTGLSDEQREEIAKKLQEAKAAMSDEAEHQDQRLQIDREYRARIDHLKARIERLEARIAEYKTDREYIHGFNAGWEEGRAVLETALRFYGRESNWRSATMYMCGHAGASQAEIDRGDKARAALAKEMGDG